jgi:hypothetical protein
MTTVSKMVGWVKYVARIGSETILVGKSEERRPLGKSERRWEDNINLGFSS